jgi:hypothetical protein
MEGNNMKKSIFIFLCFTGILFAEGNNRISIKAFYTGPQTFTVSYAPTISINYKFFKKLSLEFGFGYAYEGPKEYDDSYSHREYDSNGETVYSIALLPILAQHTNGSLQAVLQWNNVKRSDYDYYSYTDTTGQRHSVRKSYWQNYSIYFIGVEPIYYFNNHFGLFTRFGIVAYKTPKEKYVDDEAEDFPDKIHWVTMNTSTMRIGTSIRTWVVGLAYQF